jgi:hypothetical protein
MITASRKDISDTRPRKPSRIRSICTPTRALGSTGIISTSSRVRATRT